MQQVRVRTSRELSNDFEYLFGPTKPSFEVESRIETPSGPIEVRDAESFITALKAATHISDTGNAIFLLPNNFFFSAHAASARSVLPKLGLSIKKG